MKQRRLIIGVVFMSLCISQGPSFSSVLDRPTLFLELLKQNEQLSNSAVSFMARYLESPSDTDVMELKCLFRKMIGDKERDYLAQNGFSVDDFISSLDAIAAMPEKERMTFIDQLNLKAYTEAHNLLAGFDQAVIFGKEVIPLSDGNGKPIAPTNAKTDFERQLKKAYEQNGGGAKAHSQELHQETHQKVDVSQHWAFENGRWLVSQRCMTEEKFMACNPSGNIKKAEFAQLLFDSFHLENLDKSNLDETITRIEAIEMLFAVVSKSQATIAGGGQSFKDLSIVSERQKLQVKALTAKGVIKGFTDGTLKPNRQLSFGEAWTMIREALN